MIRPARFALLALLAASLACNTLIPKATPTVVPSPSVAPSNTALVSTVTPTVAPTLTAQPTEAVTPNASGHSDLYIEPGDVLLHPDPYIYSGDKVSFEIFAQDASGLNLNSFHVALYKGEPKPENQLDVETAYRYGLGQRLEATFTWVWDTTDFSGQQSLTAVLNPNDEIKQGDEDKSNNSLTFTVDVLPRSQLPQTEQDARWLTTTSDCCIFHYLSGSAAERDIANITKTGDEALAFVEDRMGHQATQKMEFNLINRLLGQGGFTADSVTITYIDRDYSGGGLVNVFRHEATHALNRPSSGNRPSLIEEGTATYVAGGHFKEEPFEPRMVGLLALGRYIPLTELADDFYNSQHEIGYLEGAAFIDYLVKTYGWKDFSTLMVAFQRAGTQSASLDGGLRLIYNKTLAQMESEWLTHLRAQPVDKRWQADVQLTVAYYDTMRRYQQADDPSAYFLTAWIPNIGKAVHDNIVADYDRHPDAPINIALETLLVEANRALNAGDYATTQINLDAVNAVLDAGGDFKSSALATNYLSITQTLLDAGYEAQTISLQNNTATVSASRATTPEALTELTLKNTNGLWQMN
jgi:hypothetical protein